MDKTLRSHEYIHLLEYAADPKFIHNYLAYDQPNAAGGPTNTYESIAYTWGYWIANFKQYGGGTRYPWNVFPAPPVDPGIVGYPAGDGFTLINAANCLARGAL